MAKTRINGILLIYHHTPTPIASNIFEHINSFRENSRFPVWEVNAHVGFPEALRELQFRVIVLHYSLFGWLPFSLGREFQAYLAESGSSYKVAFFQDEYRWWKERSEVLNRFKVDCVYTCVEPEYFQATYRKYTQVPRLETYLPGYVSDEMVKTANKLSKADAERTVDIGYRGRLSYVYMGKGAREKHEIGVRFREKAAGQGLALDIETEESKRIYGDDWLAFLGNCRAVLGVEAGVSIFDIDDEVFPSYERLLAEHPELGDMVHEGYNNLFEEVYERALAQYDGKGVYYRTLSPRVFEAAAVRACQILYEGRYSGILKPMVHYIPLRKDFTNIGEVIRLYRDERVRRELTENCYRDLIASEAYGYQRFIEKFDEGLIAAGMKPGISPGLVRQVTDRLKDSERLALMKKVEIQQLEYQELMNKHVALQVQYMEQQKQLHQLLHQNPRLRFRHFGSLGMNVFMLLRKRNYSAVKDQIASALLPYPAIYNKAHSFMQGWRKLSLKRRNRS